MQNSRVTRYLIDEEEANMEPKVAVLTDATHLLGVPPGRIGHRFGQSPVGADRAI
jgi:hypothetical protein